MHLSRITFLCGAASLLLAYPPSPAAAQVAFGSTDARSTRRVDIAPPASTNTFGFAPDQAPQPFPQVQSPGQQAPAVSPEPLPPQAGGPGGFPNSPGGGDGFPNAPGAGGPGFSGRPPPPGMGPQQSGQNMSVRDYVVGTWQGQISNVQMGTAQVTVTFLPDGSFMQRVQLMSVQFSMTIAGHYDIQTDGQSGAIIFAIQQWQPRQICAPGNPYNCQPLNFPPQDTVGFRPMSRDTMQTTNGMFQRVNG